MNSIFKTIFFSIPVGITVVDVIGYVARVDGVSMKPTLNPDKNQTEYVFLNKYKARTYSVERGEIVSIISPKDPNQRLIKRVVGIEGDTIKTLGYKEKFIKVKPGHFWVEGDHFENSLDSNTFGQVPLGLLTAKATSVVWPLENRRTLSSHPIRHPVKFGKLNDTS